MIKVYNSLLIISESKFQNIDKLNSGSAIIDTTNSTVQMKSVIMSNNYASNGLIEISRWQIW